MLNLITAISLVFNHNLTMPKKKQTKKYSDGTLKTQKTQRGTHNNCRNKSIETGK